MEREQLIPILLRLPASVLEWLDQYRQTMTMPPSRTQLIRYLIDESRKRLQEKEKAAQPHARTLK